jgi:hypothetical protein
MMEEGRRIFRNKLGHVRSDPDKDVITSKLGALHLHQFGIPAPAPPQGSFNIEAAGRGRALFNAKPAASLITGLPYLQNPDGTCNPLRRSVSMHSKPTGHRTGDTERLH